MGTTPGWARGFIPTAQQWSDAFSGKSDDQVCGYATPTSGASLITAPTSGGWILEPASELASLTIPMAVGTFEGQLFTVSTTQTIDTFQATPSGGQTLRAPGPYVLAADSAVTWRFRLANSTWYPWA